LPTLRILYDVEYWAYHNRAAALLKYAPADFDVTISQLDEAELPGMSFGGLDDSHYTRVDLGHEPPDLIFSLPRLVLPRIRAELKKRRWGTKVIGSWNMGWPARIAEFGDVRQVSDALIINNRDFWVRMGQLPGTHLLANGVDLDIFHVRQPMEQRRPRILWVGSEMARHRKGYDEFLAPLETRLANDGIDCDFQLIDSVNGDKHCAREMAEWYNTGTVLVCASSVEGTPNIALEAAACGCTVVSTAVGNMPELLRDGENGHLVARDSEALREGIHKAMDNYHALAQQMQHDIQAWSWRRRSVEFFNLFREISAPRSRNGARA